MQGSTTDGATTGREDKELYIHVHTDKMQVTQLRWTRTDEKHVA